MLGEQPRLDRLRPGGEAVVEQPRAVEEMHLPDRHDVEHGKERFELDPRTGLLVGLAARALRGRLAEFEKPRR